MQSQCKIPPFFSTFHSIGSTISFGQGVIG
nr:MAG TPA: hypothetical protein [Caudoviricetes sp.]